MFFTGDEYKYFLRLVFINKKYMKICVNLFNKKINVKLPNK